MIRKFVLASSVLLSLIIQSAFCQESFLSRASPLALAAVRYKDAYLKITYSQPLKKGREIFGKLVPYGQVWRLGANEATEVTLTKDMLINNVLLKAGTYSLFTIPQADKWTMIINSDTGLWGAYNYNQKLDVLRFDIPVQTNPEITEAFTISIAQKNDLADLLILWDNVKVLVPLKFIN
jgi:hypothetical protein